MSDEDLFADSDGDTDDLIAESKSKPVAKKKRLLKKKLGGAKRKRNDIPDADKPDDDDDEGGGLFDSDNEDGPSSNKSMSKRERMEALRAKKRQAREGNGSPPREETKRGGIHTNDGGYDSAGSINSAEIERTKEDNDFIDTEGDDAEAVSELYAEQHFDDEPLDDMDHEPGKKKHGRSGSSKPRKQSPDAIGNADPDNPIMAAVLKMKKKKRTQKGLGELELEAKEFLAEMERAADQDEQAISERRPATQKLRMLQTVTDMLARRDMTRPLLDLELLAVCKRWIQPLPSGALGNVTIRQRIIESISHMTGENGITAQDLKRSEFGKVVMSLCMHRSETPALKRQLRQLIEQWSRPIFQKSGNMRDLERVHASRGDGGLAGISRIQQQQEQYQQKKQASAQGNEQDLQSLIASGSKGKGDSGAKRVRVPFSKGFQYTVRPTNKVTKEDAAKRRSPTTEVRGNLNRRMMEKSRAVTKNQRSANISVEGRKAK